MEWIAMPSSRGSSIPRDWIHYRYRYRYRYRYINISQTTYTHTHIYIFIYKNSHIYSWCSVAKSCLTLWPHGLQDTKLPCLLLSLRVCSNSCPIYINCRRNQMLPLQSFWERERYLFLYLLFHSDYPQALINPPTNFSLTVANKAACHLEVKE